MSEKLTFIDLGEGTKQDEALDKAFAKVRGKALDECEGCILIGCYIGKSGEVESIASTCIGKIGTVDKTVSALALGIGRVVAASAAATGACGEVRQ